MMYARAKILKMKLATIAMAAAVVTGVAPLAFGQDCPATGCSLPGITVPNNLSICPTGANVHDPAQFNRNTQLCNTQPIDPATWRNGPQNDLTPPQAAAPFWNQIKTRMAQGLPLVGKRWTSAADYCNVAAYNATNNHFSWADERYTSLNNDVLFPAWIDYCPGLDFDTTAARGTLRSSLEEREAQKNADGGSAVFFQPMNSVRDAQEAIYWTYWPPFGHRSAGGSNVYNTKIAQVGAGSYRATFNNNLVMIGHISTVAGAMAASGIVAVDGIHGLLLDEEDLAFQVQNPALYTQLANGVRAAAAAAHKYLCTFNRTVSPHSITCLPN